MRYDDLMYPVESESRKAKKEFDLLFRKFRENRIDIFASNHVLREDDHYGVEWLRYFSPDWCAMKDAPYASMDKDWAFAAEETFEIIARSIWRFFAMYDDNFNRDKADPELMKMYDQVIGILDKLDKVTGAKAAEAEFEKFITEGL
jgi:hypothetical protein